MHRILPLVAPKENTFTFYPLSRHAALKLMDLLRLKNSLFEARIFFIENREALLNICCWKQGMTSKSRHAAIHYSWYVMIAGE